MMKEKYERGEIDCEGDIKRKTSNVKTQKKKEMTDIEKAKLLQKSNNNENNSKE